MSFSNLSAANAFVAEETPARCEPALLPGGDAEDALAAITEHEERLDAAG